MLEFPSTGCRLPGLYKAWQVSRAKAMYSLSQEKYAYQAQQSQQDKIDNGEFRKEPSTVRMLGMCIKLHADEACETCNRCAESSNVHPQEKSMRIAGEAGKQQCRGNIAYNLACSKRNRVFPPCKQSPQQTVHTFESGKIAGLSTAQFGHQSQVWQDCRKTERMPRKSEEA